MKNNYKIGDEIRVISPLHFAFGLIGHVLSNNSEASKPLTIIINNDGGSWSFLYSDVQSTKESLSQGLKTTVKQNGAIMPEHIEIISKNGLKNVFNSLAKESELMVKEKRPYKRRDKTEPPKIKRIYLKKDK